MKTKLLAIAVTLLTICSSNADKPVSSNTIPIIPAGIMTATPTIAQVGTYPRISWNIMYPSTVANVATLMPTGTIKLSQAMYVSVQPIGTGVTACHVNTKGLPTDARLSVNGGPYNQLFYGVGAENRMMCNSRKMQLRRYMTQV